MNNTVRLTPWAGGLLGAFALLGVGAAILATGHDAAPTPAGFITIPPATAPAAAVLAPVPGAGQLVGLEDMRLLAIRDGDGARHALIKRAGVPQRDFVAGEAIAPGEVIAGIDPTRVRIALGDGSQLTLELAAAPPPIELAPGGDPGGPPEARDGSFLCTGTSC